VIQHLRCSFELTDQKLSTCDIDTPCSYKMIKRCYGVATQLPTLSYTKPTDPAPGARQCERKSAKSTQRNVYLNLASSHFYIALFWKYSMASSSPSKQASPNYDLTAAPKNSKGGVLVTDAEISAAFAFFDTDGESDWVTVFFRTSTARWHTTRRVLRLMMQTLSSISVLPSESLNL